MIICIITFNLAYSQTVSVSIAELKVDNSTIPLTGPIDLNQSNYKNVKFRVNLDKDVNYTIGNCRLWIWTKSGNGTTKNRAIIDVYSVNFTNSSSTSILSYDFYADEFDFIGGTLFAELVQNDSPGAKWTSNIIPVKKKPTYTISPTPINYQCGNNAPLSFIVSNNAPGYSHQYQWNFGSSWTLTGGSITSNSVTLIPNSFPLSNVNIIPTFNGGMQSGISTSVSLAPFVSTAVLAGSSVACISSSSAYSMNNLGAGCTVTWSLSNTGYATLSATSGASVTLNAIAEGTFVLTALVTNPCGQTNSETKTITIGRPAISNYTIQGGYDNVPKGTNSILSIAPATGVTNYLWSVVPLNSSCINPDGTIIGGTTLPYATSNGALSVVIHWGNCTGQYRVQCKANNSCASAYYSDKLVTVYNPSVEDPCLSKLVISPNPVKSDKGDFSVNIIAPIELPPCDNGFRKKGEVVTISEIKIYDLDSKLLYLDKQKTDKVNLSGLNLRKGYYVLEVTTSEGEIKKKNFIIE